MQPRRDRRPVWQPARLSRLSAFLKNALSKITLKGLALVVVALPLVLYVYREVTRDVLIIDPFTVPKSFEEAGLTPEVMANRIGDMLRQMETATDSSMKKDTLAAFRDEGSPPDVEIPGTKLGLKTVVDITRSVFAIYPKHISGDIVVRADLLAKTEPLPANQQATVTVYLARGRNRNAAVSIDVAADDVGMLVRRAAETVLEQVNPYVFASYLEDRRDYRRAVEIAGAIAQDPSEDLPHKAAALSLWGGVLDDQKKYGEAIGKFQKAVELDPKLGFTYNNWGVALNGLRKYDEAIARFRKALELDPKRAAYPYSGWGEALRKQGKYDEAIAMFRKALDLDPKHKSAYDNWGNALWDQGKYDEAIARYQKAVELDPKDSEAYNNWGEALRSQGKFDEAVAKYQKAIEFDPKNAIAYNNWGEALRSQAKYSEALAKYQQAIELDPGIALAYNNWGVLLNAQKKYDEAIARYQKAIELDPGIADAYGNWGAALFAQMKYDEAVGKFRKALELDPKSESAYSNLGTMFFVQKRYDQAIANFQKAIDLDPKDALVYTLWGHALQAQGKQIGRAHV